MNGGAMEPKAKYKTKTEAESMERLCKHLGPKWTKMLADLLDEVATKTGYGEVRIVVADRNVVQMKEGKSYR